MTGKKALIVVVLGLLVLACVYWFLAEKESPLESNELTDKSQKNEKSKTVIAEKQQKLSKRVVSDDSSSPVQYAEAKTCEQLNQQCPECESEFNILMEDIFINVEDLAATGSYSTMPIESLASLADSKDTSAMLVQGTDLLWDAVLGVRMMNRSKQYTDAQVRDIVKQHKIDFEQFEKGERLLYQAAALGRFGALMELVQIHGLLQRQLVKKAYDAETIEAVLVNKWAHQKLFKAVHQNDQFLWQSIDYTSLNRRDRETLATLHADKTESEIESLLSDLESRSQKLFLELKQAWVKDREYLGEDAFPKLMQRKLEDYSLQAQKLCWNTQS
ncbi:hypothetical protein [Kangiella sp. TOML190]|uniref:hypothetical protein n=1 Tax=Kangiella sp. TOML190 TaxID=2931351 RepID=UPI00203C0554|nr:hypothetical protein [Kangiella sp. TOML190]